ncbi:hypothetical protein BD560DRAFT_421946 [Blakeslea trispora]|nr:hypothetical protein BD560DRAFT_421946 [Blakeslea trispora]
MSHSDKHAHDMSQCIHCSKDIEEGEVVSFGGLLFHIQCFNCAKCGQSVDKKENLLLLDSKPVCNNCAFTCTMCNEPIQDEVITAGEKTYHALCFQCIACKKPIQDLVFTQTTKGIYCVPCYDLKRQKKRTDLPTPTPSPSQSKKQNDLFPDFTMDFFNSESTELANLPDSLGVSLDSQTTQSRLSRASELLKSSLSVSMTPSDATHSTPQHSQPILLSPLESASLQNASQEVLQELTQLQHDLAHEATLQKQQELFDEAMYQKSLKTQIRSLLQERDWLQAQTKDLKKERDAVLRELADTTYKLYTNPASPTRRSRKASDASSIFSKVSSRHSFIAQPSPTLVRLKKKGSTLFHKLKESTFKFKQDIYSHSTLSSGSLQSLSKESLGHTFKSISFIRPAACSVCQDKIWGRSDYRCERCGLACHARCAYEASVECKSMLTLDSVSSQSSLDKTKVSITGKIFFLEKVDERESMLTFKLNTSMFGYDLIERAQEENRSVPYVVEACIEEIERRGLDYEGIYRKSGGAAQIRAIQLGFDQGDIDLSDEQEYNDLGAITSVLKQYFRDLPDPLLTSELYEPLTQVTCLEDNEEKLKAMREVIHRLPKEHFDTAGMLFKHLCRVHEQVDKNRMSIKNLAMVFAPTVRTHVLAHLMLIILSERNGDGDGKLFGHFPPLLLIVACPLKIRIRIIRLEVMASP